MVLFLIFLKRLQNYEKSLIRLSLFIIIFYLCGNIRAMKQFLLIITTILSCLLCACTHQQTSEGEQGDTLRLKYAENLTVVDYQDYTLVTLKDPWNVGKTLHTYVLVPRDKGEADISEHPSWQQATMVRTPLQRAVSFNTAHAWLIGELGATNQLKGVADLKYMLLPEIHQRVKDGRIADCGDSMAPDIEKLIALQTDGILLSPFENSGGYGRLEEIGVPIIECADYMETSALGRAEWMKFYGRLFGKAREADSMFAVVDSSYYGLRDSQNSRSTPSMITEKLTGSTWYVPGGKSSVAQLIAAAGGSYAWAKDEHSGSLALPFETILSKAGDADVWIFNDQSEQPMTYERLAAEYHGYAMMKPFKQRRVWYVNSLKVPYFEQVSFRPDWLLRDYIILLHPDCGLGAPKYYRPLKE